MEYFFELLLDNWFWIKFVLHFLLVLIVLFAIDNYNFRKQCVVALLFWGLLSLGYVGNFLYGVRMGYERGYERGCEYGFEKAVDQVNSQLQENGIVFKIDED